MRVAAAALLAVVSLAAPAGAATAPALPPRLAAVHTWAFAIGDGTLTGNLARRYAGYDLVVVDGQEATVPQLRALRRAGKLVLGYLDVGTIEPYRPWYRRAKQFRLGYWREWGEWYANVDAAGYRKLIRSVAASLLRKGLDGLFLDNVDMVETHPRQAAGMRTLVRGLAGFVHRRGGFLFAQNGADVIGPLLRYLDGWNREDVSSTWNGHRYVAVSPADRAAALAELRRMRTRGLLTLATDYVAKRDAQAAARAVRTACWAGALPFVSNIELTRVPARPARCG